VVTDLEAGDPRHGTRNGYGRGCRCEPCIQANRDYVLRYRAANKAKLQEYDRRHYEQNADKIRAYQANYRAANPEKVRAVMARWYVKNSEKRRADSAAYQAAHLEKKREWQARDQAKNPEVHRANQRARTQRKRDQWVEDVDHALVWERDGGICHICKEPATLSDWHLDHVVPLISGGLHSYANTAVSHPQCNIRKGGKS